MYILHLFKGSFSVPRKIKFFPCLVIDSQMAKMLINNLSSDMVALFLILSSLDKKLNILFFYLLIFFLSFRFVFVV